MIVRFENENTYLEKIDNTYKMYINGWFCGGFTEKRIAKDAKAHGWGTDNEAIKIFERGLEIERRFDHE